MRQRPGWRCLRFWEALGPARKGNPPARRPPTPARPDRESRGDRRLPCARTSSGDEALAEERAQALATAERFGLSYDEIEGTRERVYPQLYGPWDERFLVIPKGGTIRLTDSLADGIP
jgi:hypothetical protein